MTTVEAFLQQHPDITELEVLSVDINGHFFGKRYPINKLKSFCQEGLAFPGSMFALDSVGEPLDGIYFGIEDGDPDADFKVIENTLSINRWSSQKRAQLIATTADSEPPTYFEPRSVLQRVVNAYRDQGWHPMVAFELEFYLFDIERDDKDIIKIVRNPKTGRFDASTVLSSSRISDFESVIDEIISACNDQSIETGAISAELGPGQFEINFNHHADVMRAADETCLFKRTVIEVAKKHGMQASFMAKPLIEQAGNGLHMHISVIDNDGKNIFSDGDSANPKLHHAIGGLLDTMPACMSFWAPNVNSYRRYLGGISCAPVSLTWGHENRTVAFRIPIARNGAWRVENRVPGADANPYLAMAATLAAMLHGLKNDIDPGPESELSIDSRDKNLPLDLVRAVTETADNTALKEILGDDFIEIYCTHRLAEKLAFENHISSREYDWYL